MNTPSPAADTFGEPFFGYSLNAGGYHNGKSLPITTKQRLMNYISCNIYRVPEIRITDIGDNLVMHIVNKKVIFPLRNDGQQVIWNDVTNDFSLEVPTDQRTQVKRFYTCIKCKKPFTDANVKTSAGWCETQITGMCETCFDAIFDDDESDEEEIW